MKTLVLSVATVLFTVPPIFASTRTKLNTRRRKLKPEKSYAKSVPSPQKSYYAPPAHPIAVAPVYYAPAPPPGPPPKLVQAKVLAEKAKFLVTTESPVIDAYVKISQGISSEVKAADSLIDEAKVKLEYGHKDYSCDLLELSESLIEAAGSQLAIGSSSASLVAEKLKMAIAKVEAHIKWLSSQSGYGYAHVDKAITAALDALKLAAEKAEAAEAAGLDSLNVLLAAIEAFEASDAAVKEALKYCVNDDTYYYKDHYDLVAYFKKALVAVAEAVATFDAAMEAVVESITSYDEMEQVEMEEAVADALQAILDAIAPQKGYY